MLAKDSEQKDFEVFIPLGWLLLWIYRKFKRRKKK